MGQIIGGNYVLSQTGDQTDSALLRALNPDATPTVGSDELVESGGVAAALPSPASIAPDMDGTASAGSASDYARADHVHPTDTSRAAPGYAFTVTLAAAGWSGGAQTVSSAAFAASGYSYIVAPESGSYAAYADAQVYADDVTVDGSMTFHHAGDAPAVALTVNILRQEATE